LSLLQGLDRVELAEMSSRMAVGGRPRFPRDDARIVENGVPAQEIASSVV